MRRSLPFLFLALSSCTALLSGLDREASEDAEAGDTASDARVDSEEALDTGALADSSDANSRDASLDYAGDSRFVDTTGDSFLDGGNRDALAAAVDAEGGPLDVTDVDSTVADTGEESDTRCTESCDLTSLRCEGGIGFVCEMRSGCPTWVQRVTCQGAEMCCPSGGEFACVTPDADHCFSCSNVCGGTIPACSSTRKACVCEPGSCPSNLGCDDTTGTCTPCTTPTSDATDFYADVRAGAAGTGSANCPFRSIGDALALARLSSAAAKTVHVAPGKYTAEPFPLVVRNGVTLEGAGAEKVIIAGLGQYTSRLPATQQFLVTAVLGDPSHENTIRGVTLQANAPAKIAHYGLLCDDGNLTTAKGNGPPKNPPNSFVRDVTFGGDYDTAVGLGGNLSSQSGGNLRIANVHFEGSWNGIWAVTCNVDSDPPLYGNIEVSASRFTGQRDGGIWVRGCASMTLANNVFEDSPTGFISWSEAAIETDHSVLRVDSNTFQRMTGQAFVVGGMTVETFSDNTFINNTTTAHDSAIALRLDTSGFGGKIYARGNHFIGNDIAILVQGSPTADAKHLFDFGTASDPGRNEFRCNSSTLSNLVRYAGFDVGVDAATTPGWVFHLAGNLWDHDAPSFQASAQNRYNTDIFDGVDVFLGSGNATTVMDMSGVTRWTGACPAEHVPGPSGVEDAGRKD